MPTGDDDIEVRVILRDEFSRDAENIIDVEERMTRTTRTTSEATDDLSDAQRRNSDEQRRQEASIRAANRQRDAQGRFIVTITETTETNTRTVRRNTRERDKNTKSLAKSVKGWFAFGKVLTLFKYAIMLDGVAKGLAAVGAAGGIAIGAIGGIAPLTGALLPLPALLGGAALGIATLKIGFSGLGEAMKAFNPEDMTAFNEAIKDMGPNGQAAAEALGWLAEDFKPIKKMVQERLLDGFADIIWDLGDSYLPILSDALTDTAGKLNDTLKIGAGFLQMPNTIDAIALILQNASKMAEQMGHAFNGALRGTIHMFSAVDGVAVTMMEDIAYGMNQLADAIYRNQEEIGGFAADGYNGLKYMLGVVADLAVGFWNIAKVGAGLFDGMGTRFHDMAQNFRQWTGSVEGQAKIKEYFDKLKPVLESLINLGKEVAGAIGRIAGDNMGTLAPMIDKITEMIPTMENIINSASGAAPAFLDIANAILQIVGGTDMLTPSAAILQMATPIIEGFANIITSLPQPLQTAIGWIVTFALVIRTAAIQAMFAWAMQFVVIQNLVMLFRVYMLIAQQAVLGFARTMLIALFTTPIGWLILGVMALVGAFILLWKNSETFRNIIKGIGQWFVDVWNNQIYPLAMKTWEWIKSAWDKAYAVVMPVVEAIVNWVKSKWDTIVAVFNVFVEVVKTVFGIVWTIISTYATIWWTVISTAFNIIKTIVMTVFNVIATIISTAVGIWLGFVMPVLNTIGTVFMGLVGIVGKVIGLVVAIFKLGWNIIRLVVNVAMLIVFGIIKLITVIVQWVVGQVVSFWTAAWNIISTVVRIAVEIIKAIIGWIWDKVMAVLNPIIGFFQMVWAAASAIVGAAVNVIMGIIGWIWDRVMGVVSPIASFIGGAFETASGYVGAAINVIKVVVGEIWDKVTSILDSVKSKFETVWGSIRDFVMGIINRIKDALSGITDIVGKISSGISGAADFVGGLIPGRATGGPVTAGTNYLVGERGPEAFVGSNGKVAAIGAHGPEVKKFSNPGFVVPNHVLGGQSDSSVPSNVMNRLTSAMEGNTAARAAGGAKLAERSTGSQESYMSKGDGDYFDFSGANFGGDLTEADIERIITKVTKKTERNKKERG